jgi:hypothetical protein
LGPSNDREQLGNALPEIPQRLAFNDSKLAGILQFSPPLLAAKHRPSKPWPNFAFDSLNGGGFIQRIAVVRFAQGRLVVCRKISAVMISENKSTPPGAMVKPPVLIITQSPPRSI